MAWSSISKYGAQHPTSAKGEQTGVSAAMPNLKPSTSGGVILGTSPAMPVSVKMTDLATNKTTYHKGVSDIALNVFNNIHAKGNISKVIHGVRPSYLGKKFSFVSAEEYANTFNQAQNEPEVTESNQKEPKGTEKKKMVYNHILQRHIDYVKNGGVFNITSKAILKHLSKQMPKRTEEKSGGKKVSE